MKQGIVIIAQNTSKVDYIRCASVLAKSIRKTMPKINLSLITDDTDFHPLFDQVIALPYGDLDKDGDWKLINDWQVYEASPYEYTIKLEADMYIPKSIEHWWDVLKTRELVVSTHIRNYKQEISTVRAYRQFIDDNNLPDCYNSITYFKKSDLAEKFFKIVKDVFVNWNEYKSVLKCNIGEKCSTDWAYAIAAHIVGVENSTLPSFKEMSMIHMKQFVNELPSEDWTDTLVYEILDHSLRINTIPQLYPFHYHIKKFANKLI